MQNSPFLSGALTKESVLRCSKTSALCLKKVRGHFRGFVRTNYDVIAGSHDIVT